MGPRITSLPTSSLRLSHTTSYAVYALIHLFYKHVLSAYCVSSILLSMGVHYEISVVPALMELKSRKTVR